MSDHTPDANTIETTLDLEFETPVYSPVCVYCRHLRHYGQGRVCNAFPDGIPLVIWLGENDHHEPFPGDHGIQFERVPAQRSDGT